MANNISQYFKVTISSPKGSKKQTTVDATKYILKGVTMSEEDGLIKELNFDMDDAFLMMDVISVGMRVDLIGGTLQAKKFLFSGYIKSVEPMFLDSGDIRLSITAHSQEGGSLGIKLKDLIYPSKNHPRPWATNELTYSDIILRLAEDSGIKVSAQNIKVKRDIKASFSKGTVRQKSMTDWAFMQMLAKKIHCTLWTEEKNGLSEIYLYDDTFMVNTLAPYTLFFLAKKNRREFIPIDRTSKRQIQIQKARIKLDTQNKKGAYNVSTNSGTGKTEVHTTREDDEGNLTKWVLDEEKVRALPSKERQELIALFTSGKVVWEGDEDSGEVSAKQYFKEVVIGDSSREGEAKNTEIVVSEGDVINSEGTSTTHTSKKNSGSKSFKTVVDEKRLKTLSPEKRTALLGRIARQEITEEDKTYYKVVDTTPKKTEHNNTHKQEQETASGGGSPQTSSKKRKRDDGFTITATIFGDLNIVPRKSYVLEGLGKYSNTYYLYKIDYIWGRNGFMMELVFVK